MRASLTILLSLLLALAGERSATAAVDSALVGTWKLQWPGADVLWVVRLDGVYRLHGPGANPRQLGSIEAANGQWSITSPLWQDHGSYRLVDSDTWTITGQVGTGTWKRVFMPENANARASAAEGCSLATNAEAAGVLYAPATGGPDRRSSDPVACRFTSQLDSLDEVAISWRANQGSFFQNLHKSEARSAIDVPGLGDQAYATVLAGGALKLQFLRGNDWVSLTLRLNPDSTAADLPLLVELARAVEGRLQSTATPGSVLRNLLHPDP